MTIKKKKNPHRRHQSTWIFLGWLLICVVWLILTDGHCAPSYYGDYGEIVSYTGILSRHSAKYLAFNSPLFVFIVFNIVAFILLFRTKRLILSLFLFPVEAFGCLVIFAAVFCGDGTQLNHIDTVEFDGKTYHLALGDDVAGGMDVYSQLFIIHECTDHRDNCRGREVGRNYLYNIDELRFEVNNNRLVVLLNGKVIFTLDSTNVEMASLFPDVVPLSVSNIDEIHSFAEIHFDTVNDLEWASDEMLLFVAGSNAVWYHELNIESIRTTNLPISSRTAVSFDSNSGYLATTNWLDGRTTIWDAANPIEIASLPNSAGDVDFSPNGQMLATTNNRRVVIYNTQDFSESDTLSLSYSLRDITFSPNNLFLAASGYDPGDDEDRGFARVWNIQTQGEVFSYRTPYLATPEQISFSPNSRFIAIPSEERIQPGTYPAQYERFIHIFDYQTNTEILTLPLPSDVGPINRVIWSQDGTMLIVSTEASLSFWDAETGDLLHIVEITESEEAFSSLALNYDGTILASGLQSGGIRFWSVPSTKE